MANGAHSSTELSTQTTPQREAAARHRIAAAEAKARERKMRADAKSRDRAAAKAKRLDPEWVKKENIDGNLDSLFRIACIAQERLNALSLEYEDSSASSGLFLESLSRICWVQLDPELHLENGSFHPKCIVRVEVLSNLSFDEYIEDRVSDAVRD